MQESFDLGRGLLLRAVLFRRRAGESDRLLLAAHHLVIDGVSWRILLGDLTKICQSMSAGEPVILPRKTTSFQRWAELLKEHSDSPAIQAQLAYWTALEEEPAPRLPLDHFVGPNTVASADGLAVSLDPAATRALLQDVPTAYRTQINEVLLTALVRAFATWTSSPALLMELEGHGREAISAEVDVSRTVGWFTTFYPVRLDLVSEDPGELLKQVKERLRAIPGRGLGYGLLRYLCTDEPVAGRLRTLSRPEVSFNYLGQLDQALPDASLFSPAPEPSGQAESPQQMRRSLLAVNAHVLHGSLTVGWVYSRNLHRRSTIERLAESFMSHLRVLIAHCLWAIEHGLGGYTPSDFPLAQLGQADLDRLLGRERGIEDLYPLSPLQEGLLFHSLYSPGSGVYVVQVCCELRGLLDTVAFAEAWQRVLERNAVLRTSFHWQGLERPLQAVHARVEVELERQDWRDLSVAEQKHRLEALLSSDRERGFDLSRAPLMRWVLIETGEQEYRFLWSQHHILLDGWSSSAVTGEFLVCYEALRTQSDPVLPPRAPYRNFIAWLEKQDLSCSEEYWRRTLAGWTAPTPLGVDVLGDAGAEGSRVRSAWLSAEGTAALRAQARRHQLTLNTLVQGAWGALLGRYSGRTEVVFGVTVSGRPADLAEVESMVGVFINTLPARLGLGGETRLLPWLQELQRQQSELRQHEHNPLVKIQGWSEVGRGVPLFESILAFENYPRDASLRQAAISLEVGEVQTTEQNNYPLAVVVVPGDQLLVRMDYIRSRFDVATVDRMQGHLRNLLESLGLAALEQEERGLLDLPLLGEPERHQLLLEWGRSPGAEPGDISVIGLIESRAARSPEATAIVLGEERLSYRDLDRRSNQLAHRLRGLGIGVGDRVGILLRHSPAMVLGVLGVLKSGAAYVPLDPGHPRNRLSYMAADAAVSAWLSEGDLSGLLDTGALPVIDLSSDWSRMGPYESGSPEVVLVAQSPAYVIYTSGSTGEPKGVSISHGALLQYVHWASETYLNEPDLTVPLYSSLSFDLTVTSLYAPLLRGHAIRIYREGDEPAIREVFREGRVEVVKLTPSHLELVRDLDNRGSRIRRLIVGGEQLERRLAEEVVASFGGRVEILNEYGPTEATVGCMLHRFDPLEDLRNSVPIGRAAAGAEIYVLDERLSPVPQHVMGELYLGGPGLATGYLGRPELTAQRFVPHPFADGQRLYRTGDLARMLGAGRLEFLGRCDEQVKIRGYRIEPGEIEAALTAHPEVRAAAVIVREDLPGGRGLAAYFVAAGEDSPSATDLRGFLRERLPEAMVPTVYVLLPRIPLTSHGKIDRGALATDGIKLPASRTAFVAPETEIETTLAALWRHVLQVDRVGLYDNFFDLGGHSLLMLQLYSQVQSRFGASLKMVELFEFPTISSMAKRLGAGGQEQEASSRGRDRAAARLETMRTRTRLRPREDKEQEPAGIANE